MRSADELKKWREDWYRKWRDEKLNYWRQDAHNSNKDIKRPDTRRP